MLWAKQIPLQKSAHLSGILNRIFPYDLLVPTQKESRISNDFDISKRGILTENALLSMMTLKEFLSSHLRRSVGVPLKVSKNQWDP